jgi:hypothetical protein
MSLDDNRKYQCEQCGAWLDIPWRARPTVRVTATRDKPNVRTLIFGGAEIHSCSMFSFGEYVRERAAQAR